ncbi:MAG: motility protein A [Clostridia bacterium]|nr:motility protein A [Clostridia bacterium]
MDIASLLGIIVCCVLVIMAICTGDDGFAALINFYDFKSVLITIGGTFCSVMAGCSMKDYIKGLKSFTLIFKAPSLNTTGIIQKIIELSNVARKEGLLSLEEAAGELNDTFLQKGIMLIVDGTDPDLVRGILETEMLSIESRHKTNIGFWDNIASMGPAWGMVGTLVGLINMLQNMEDASTIGPSMSVALITTLYGSLLANWIAIPASTKLKANNESEMVVKEIIIEGLLSIQAGENPRVIEEKLKSFLSPNERNDINKEGGGEE